MIPFATQRKEGQDLATHLLNQYDNEYVEVVSLRGSIARDLHGAFAEWEVQADTLTKCENYLYSLSVNPKRDQPLTREQYDEYLTQVENKLGLAEQPRAVVFHIKNGREHCHAIYSRIDVDNEKAVHMAFDKDKLMMVTRQFAREHQLTLPDGYSKAKGQHEGQEPLTLYEKNQQETTGISKAERMAIVTDLWRQSDCPKAFVSALEQAGYLLCTGKRDYVLVDYYGHMNSLPKLIDDKQVRTKECREFLDKEFPKASLPDVNRAKELIREHRKTEETFQQSQAHAERLEMLKRSQVDRRKELEKQTQQLKDTQRQDAEALLMVQQQKRTEQLNVFENEKAGIDAEREARKPTGLRAMLAKVSGFNYVQGKLYDYHDRQRQSAFDQQKKELLQKQEIQRQQLEQAQHAALRDMQRRLDAITEVEKRELKSFDTEVLKEKRTEKRGCVEHMPSMALVRHPPGRHTRTHRAKHFHYSETAIAMRDNRQERTQNATVNTKETFESKAATPQGQHLQREGSPKPASPLSYPSEQSKQTQTESQQASTAPTSESSVHPLPTPTASVIDLDSGRSR